MGISPTFHLIRTACVKIQTNDCSILLFPVLLLGAMASIKHKRVVRTIPLQSYCVVQYILYHCSDAHNIITQDVVSHRADTE